MRLLDILSNSRRERQELSQLMRLWERLARVSGSFPKRREELLCRVLAQALPADQPDPNSLLVQAVTKLLQEILTFENLLLPPAPLPPSPLPTARVWEEIKETTRVLSVVDEPHTIDRLVDTLGALAATIILDRLPPQGEEGAAPLSAPLLSLLPKPAEVIEGTLGAFLGEPRDRTLFPKLWQQLE
jgi:hypothetical protein